jgi:uncharacterized membrane protein YdfJ with MMPL/SSD domain
MRRETFIKRVTIAFHEEEVVRDMAQAVGLNVSDVCRRALRKELGVALAENQSVPADMVDKFYRYLDVKMQQDSELLSRVREYLRKSAADEQASTERQQQISAAIKASVNGAVDYYVRRLPERDPRGDFLEVWDDLQKVIQAAHGIQVSHDELYEYFRRLKA